MSDAKDLLKKLGGGQKKKQKGTPKRTGKRAAKYKAYFLFRYPERKLRRILRRNGRPAARLWAETHGALMVLHKLTGAV